jgi:hypothetical protein
MQGYHPARVFTLVYQPFALATILVLTFFEARVNTRLRLISGYSLFFMCILLIPIVRVHAHENSYFLENIWGADSFQFSLRHVGITDE